MDKSQQQWLANDSVNGGQVRQIADPLFNNFKYKNPIAATSIENPFKLAIGSLDKVAVDKSFDRKDEDSSGEGSDLSGRRKWWFAIKTSAQKESHALKSKNKRLAK